ncbi:MAG: 2-5 ligase [Phycisphaerales bacterium]|nr:2-5 ligase [Phycisphaerales bacterium]
MRLFIAIELPDVVRQHIAGLVRKGQEHCRGRYGLSWVRPENFHVTVKFLGDVSDDRLPALCSALGEIATEGPAVLRADRLEGFPPRRPSRVVAMGLAGDVGRVNYLHRSIEEHCARLGIPPDGRLYRPHITLVRCREPLPADKRDAWERAAGPLLPGPEFVASEFVLMESRLKPEGAQYIPVARFPLRDRMSTQ